MAITNTLLNNSLTAISPSLSSDIAVITMIFCNQNAVNPNNVTDGLQNIDVHVVQANQSSSNANKIINQLPISAGDTFSFSTDRVVLGVGDTIYALTTDTSQVSVTISYVTL
jgi:hypothetical protein